MLKTAGSVQRRAGSTSRMGFVNVSDMRGAGAGLPGCSFTDSLLLALLRHGNNLTSNDEGPTQCSKVLTATPTQRGHIDHPRVSMTPSKRGHSPLALGNDPIFNGSWSRIAESICVAIRSARGSVGVVLRSHGLLREAGHGKGQAPAADRIRFGPKKLSVNP